MTSTRYRHVLALLCGLLTPLAAAQAATLRADAPSGYTVTEGDTLWSIAGRFLAHPWEWPQVWRANPAIADPNRIYPGDRIIMTHDASGTHLQLERGEARVVKLSPQMRTLPRREAVTTIDRGAIDVFLAAHRVVDPDTLNDAAYIVAGDDQRLINAAGDRVFVKGELPATSRYFGIYVAGEKYHAQKDHNGSGELLGQGLIAIGEAQLEHEGTPLSTLRLIRVSREVEAGARVMAQDNTAFTASFMPHPVAASVTGHILATPDESSVVGARAIVVLDLGRHDGIEPGHVLSVLSQGESVRDPVTDTHYTLPDARAGTLMVFRSFARVSYALVMRADRPLAIGDRVGAPPL